MKQIRNTSILISIEQERKDWRRNISDEYGSSWRLKETYDKYLGLFSSYLPDYCIEGVKRLHSVGDTLLACQLLEGQILDTKPMWFVADLIATSHPYAVIQHSELAQRVVEIVAKRHYKRMYRSEDVHFNNTRRTLCRYLDKTANKMKEITCDRRFGYYPNRFFHTQDIKEFRFRLSSRGSEHYQLTIDFFRYEYKFSEKHNGFLFTRRIDRGKDEVVCFIARLSGYYREAKLLKGIYNRSTDEFTPKNINFIKKHL